MMGVPDPGTISLDDGVKKIRRRSEVSCCPKAEGDVMEASGFIVLRYGEENTHFSNLRYPNPRSMLSRCKVTEGIGIHTFEDRKRETFYERGWRRL